MRLRGRLGARGFEVRSFDAGEARATADYAPVYGASEQVTSNRLRELVRAALAGHAADVLDPLPAELDLPLAPRRARRAPLPRRPGRGRGRPRSGSPSTSSSSSSSLWRAARDEGAVGRALPPPGELVARYRAALPFTLTEHQELGARRDRPRSRPRACRCAGCSRATSAPGKTVVALYALLRAVEAGRQGALMVPTETLAEQHFLTIESALRHARGRVAAAHRTSGSAAARAAHRQRRRADRGRHARADPARSPLRRPRRRRRRRAAPLRRRAAPGALRARIPTSCT